MPSRPTRKSARNAAKRDERQLDNKGFEEEADSSSNENGDDSRLVFIEISV
jgi:hypothetical protein